MTDMTSTDRAWRQELYELMREGIPFEEKAQRALELGTQFLGVDKGHFALIDRETDHWEVLASTEPPTGQFPVGRELELGATYCRRTIESDAQVAITDAPTQGWADDPAFRTHGLHCYLGTTLVVDGAPYGTVCYVSEDPRRGQFTDHEMVFAELIARSLERELEWSQRETQLRRQTGLATALNRTLRRNIEADLPAVQSAFQPMADQSGATPDSRAALATVETFMELAEAAHELDHVVSDDVEREPTAIVDLVEAAVEPVREEYPQASVAIESDTAITTAVLPSFDRAIQELVENAVKHGGDGATVTIAIDTVPNAVEIRIADDGSGVTTREADVVDTGTEARLSRGTNVGLWLAHWIVTSHDGAIEASDTNSGTTLTVTVPRKPRGDGREQLPKRPRSRDRYHSAFENAGDGMTITDDEARILAVNAEAARIYGIDRQELLGRSIRDFLPDEFDFEAEWGEIRATDTKRDEMRIASADGGINIIEYTAKTDFIPGQHLIVSRDITERKAHERELEREIERLDDFASTLSHDLRNPLTIAQTRLELAAEDHDSEHFEPMQKAHTRIESLIEDLLTLARDGRGQTDLKRVDLPTLIQGCWTNVDTSNAMLEVEANGVIRADENRLRRVFKNLIRNAVEHGGEDVTVTIGTQEDGFYVADDGTGVPDADHDTVFEDGYSSKCDGTGFGLSIVQRGIEAHGWAITLTSGPDGGARFEITGVDVIDG